MRLSNKVMVSVGIIWLLFCIGVYMGVYHYLLPNILYLGNDGNQEIIIHRYAYTQIVNHYFMFIAFVSFVMAVFIAYWLRNIFINHAEMTQKIIALKKRSEKSDQVDQVFHAVCDHLNSIVASIALIQEKIENSKIQADEIKLLENEIVSLHDHVKQINHMIKSFQG